jgi:hypothetical protein
MIPLPQLAMCKIPKGDGNKNEEFDYNIISYFSIIIIIETMGATATKLFSVEFTF